MPFVTARKLAPVIIDWQFLWCAQSAQKISLSDTRILREIRPEWRKKEFALIPKPAAEGSGKMEELEWRFCFKDLERDLIEGQKKPVIKLLKAFRDGNPPLQRLHSYALKIMVLNLAKDNPSAVAFKEENRGNDFLATLKYLQKCLEQGKIRSYWDHKANVIGKLGTTETSNMSNFLLRAIQRLEASANTDQCAKVWNTHFGNKHAPALDKPIVTNDKTVAEHSSPEKRVDPSSNAEWTCTVM